MKNTTIDTIEFTLLDWPDLDQLTQELADKVGDTKQRYDRIIAVANGGLTMARHFGDRLGMKKISLLQTAFYADINQQEKEPQVLQPLVVDIEGENVLVFEDIVDTGTTVEFIRPLLLKEYGAKSVTIASLVSKSWASTQPDFVAMKLDSWIIYPYETRESIESLCSKWKGSGHTEEVVRERLLQIGFERNDISKFMQYNQK